MSRIRSVHPGFFTDERLVATSLGARLLFIGLGVEADDKGVFEWKPLTIKMRVFPADNVDVPALLSELQDAGAIRTYEVEGRQFGAIRNFRKFQRPKTPNDIHPAPSDIRKYVGITDAIPEKTGAQAVPFPPNGEKPSQMEDGGGKREEIDASASDVSAGEGWPDGFEETLWQLYPNQVGEAKAKAAIRACRDRGDSYDDIVVGLARYVREKPPARQWCNPQTWFSERRWTDKPAPTSEVPKAPSSENVVALTVWVSEGDQRWPALADRYKAERGKWPFKVTSTTGPGEGSHFPREWLGAAEEAA